LGDCYLYGEGEKGDFKQAVRYFILAGENGQREARGRVLRMISNIVL